MSANTLPLISVIIPVYNVKPYLEEAIDSVLHQTYTNLEIILVDDGSTDESGEMCDAYAKKDSRIRVIHQKNKGLSGARNAGLDICSGDMIAFLDSDDAYCKDTLFKLQDAMQCSGADLVECNLAVYHTCSKMDPAEANTKGQKNTLQTGLYKKQQAICMPVDGYIKVYTWNKLYKRTLWNNFQFPEGHNYEDVEIILPLLEKADSIFYLNEPLIMYRKRPGSITSSYTIKNARDRVRAYRHYLNYIRSHIPQYFEEQHLKKAVQKYYRSLLSTYFKYSINNISDKRECLAFLAQEISEIQKEINLKECSIRVKAATFFYSHIPAFLHSPILRLYQFIRTCKAKISTQYNQHQ